MNGDLDITLRNFEGYTIDRFDIDLFKKTIALEISAVEKGTTVHHEVLFGSVSAFYFCYGKGSPRFNVKPWTLMELSDIGYYDPPRDHITYARGDHETNPLDSTPNFVLDIWGTLFTIEAQEVTVDGITYQLK